MKRAFRKLDMGQSPSAASVSCNAFSHYRRPPRVLFEPVCTIRMRDRVTVRWDCFCLSASCSPRARGQQPLSAAPQFKMIHYQGVLLDAETGDPVPGAVVTTVPDPAIPRPGPTATTDGDGRFQIEIPSVPHLVGNIWRISKENYVPEPIAYRYGEFLPDNDSGATRQPLTLQTIRLAMITGVVLNRRGRPEIGGTVEFIPLAGHAVSERQPADSAGHFQAKVRPGAYLVCASAGKSSWSPLNGASVAPAFITVPVCFPSAQDYSSAEVIWAARGQTIGPLSIRLSEAQTYSIRGRIGSPISNTGHWGATIQAVAHVPVNTGPLFSRYVEGCINSDGTFSISGLRKGTYTISAVAGSRVITQRCGAPSVWKDVVARYDDCCTAVPPPSPVTVAPVYKGSRTYWSTLVSMMSQ
jgi:hypothetical protein